MPDLLLNPLHRQANATLGPWRGWTVPLRFHDSRSEYDAVRQRVGLIDSSTSGLLEVTGTDRIAFLHNLLTNDIKALPPGSGCQAALVSPTAKLLADLLVLADESSHWLVVDRLCHDAVQQTLEHYHMTEDITIHDRTTSHVLLALQGRQSRSLLHTLLNIPLAFQRPLDHRRVALEGTTIHVIDWSLTGELGVLLAVLAEDAAWLWEVLMTRGRAHGLVPIGWEALNVLRLEAGVAWYGIDMDETNLLPETGLEVSAVSDTKGCYVGQEVIARLAAHGSVSRKLMGLMCKGSLVPEAGDSIQKDGEVLGAVTSACLSPALKQPIALGYVKRPFYEVGATVEVVRNGQPIPATLARRPFIQPISPVRPAA